MYQPPPGPPRRRSCRAVGAAASRDGDTDRARDFGGAVGGGERLVECAIAARLRGATAREQAGSGHEQQRESQITSTDLLRFDEARSNGAVDLAASPGAAIEKRSASHAFPAVGADFYQRLF